MQLIIHLVIDTVLLGLIIAIYLRTSRRIREMTLRFDQLEDRVRHLTTISKYFPEFIQKGESITRNITEDLLLKESALKKLINEAEKASDKLGFMEEKIKEKKLDKDTIDKVLILVNQGFSPREIAPKLNIPLGEIELVIKLRKYLTSPIKEKL